MQARAVRPVFPMALCGLFLASVLCAQAETARPPDRLTFVESQGIWDKKAGFREPSGLATIPGSAAMWSVSDDTPEVFRLGPGGAPDGDEIEIAGLEDAEGVALDETGQRLLVLSEEDASIYVVTLDAETTAVQFSLFEMANARLLVDALDGDLDALSPEGITFDTQTGHVFIVNERGPRLLIEMSSDLQSILSVEPLLDTLGFWVPGVSDWHLDVSGLAFDTRRGALWILSDVGRCVFYFALDGTLASRFDLAWVDEGTIRRVENAEGIALDDAGDQILIVSDDNKRSRLFVFSIDD